MRGACHCLPVGFVRREVGDDDLGEWGTGRGGGEEGSGTIFAQAGGVEGCCCGWGGERGFLNGGHCPEDGVIEDYGLRSEIGVQR